MRAFPIPTRNHIAKRLKTNPKAFFTEIDSGYDGIEWRVERGHRDMMSIWKEWGGCQEIPQIYLKYLYILGRAVD